MSEEPLDTSKNDHEGFQIQWHGILLTLRNNDNHGIFGSIAEKDGSKLELLEFHGTSPDQPFPVHFHETEMECEDNSVEKRPIVQAYEAITEIRLALPEKLSPDEDQQETLLLDLQDVLWKQMTPEEQKEQNREPKPE